jgi:hypothetical protein
VVQGPVIVNDPTTGQPFPNDKIPANRMSAAALVLAQYYPQPNAPGSRLNYQIPLVGVSNQDNLNARLNETLGKNDRLSGSVGWQRSSGVNPNFLGFVDDNSNYGVSTSISWSHTYSKRLMQSVSFYFSRSRAQLTPYFASLHQDVARQLGIQGTSSLPLDWGPPNLSFTNFSGLTDGAASLSRNQDISFNYGLTLIRAKHMMSFGATYSREQLNPLTDPDGRGSFTFTGAAGSGYDFADFLLNRPAVASIRFGNADKYFRNGRFSLYAQDNWTISKVLSANFGIRWDYTWPYNEVYNRLANLDVSPGFTDARLMVSGQAGAYSGNLPASIVKHEYDGYSPSFGLAWRPFPKNTKSPTTVRLSYNRSRTIDGYTAIANNLSGQPPFARVLSIGSSASNPLAMETAFLNTPVTANTYAVDPNYRMIALNTAQLMLTQSYRGYYVMGGIFGVQASHLDQTSLPNSLPPGLAAPVNGPPSGYIYEQSNGALRGAEEVVSFGRSMASGFSASLSAVLARMTDNGALGAKSGAGNIAQDWQDLVAERATSTLMGKGYINGNWQYSTGQGKAGGTLVKGWRGALIKDWTITNTLSWRAGSPLTATVAGATAGGTGITGTLRADATGQNIAAPAGSGEPFNLAAFAVPAPGHWGTAGRNTIIGPSVWSLNASFGRVFRLGDRRSVDLRFDATNFLNHVVISGWSTAVNAYNYGLPTGTQAMRDMTANLRFRF